MSATLSLNSTSFTTAYGGTKQLSVPAVTIGTPLDVAYNISLPRSDASIITPAAGATFALIVPSGGNTNYFNVGTWNLMSYADFVLDTYGTTTADLAYIAAQEALLATFAETDIVYGINTYLTAGGYPLVGNQTTYAPLLYGMGQQYGFGNYSLISLTTGGGSTNAYQFWVYNASSGNNLALEITYI